VILYQSKVYNYFMPWRILKRTGAFILFFLGFLWALWYIGVPSKYLQETVKSRIDTTIGHKRFLVNGKIYHINIKIEGLKKKILPGVRIKRLTISAITENDTVDLLEFYNLRVSPVWSSVLKGTPVMKVMAIAGRTGQLLGSFKIRESLAADIQIEIPIEEIPAVQLVPLKAKGHLNAKALINRRELSLRFRLRPFKARDVVRGNLYLPLSFFNEIRGSVHITSGGIIVNAVNLEGNQVEGTFSGQIIGNTLRGLLKVIPDENFPRVLLYPLKIYERTTGIYEIPVNLYLGSV